MILIRRRAARLPARHRRHGLVRLVVRELLVLLVVLARAAQDEDLVTTGT